MDTDIKTKVLVVEDDKALSDVLKDKLKSGGFTPLLAKDGEAGLKISLKEKPDLILLDVIMPKMNGLKMLEELRGDAWGGHVPVLLLSNDDNPEHIKETLKYNASDYLIKSDWELEDIVKRIKEILKL